jgi:hypothetical protein
MRNNSGAFDVQRPDLPDDSLLMAGPINHGHAIAIAHAISAWAAFNPPPSYQKAMLTTEAIVHYLATRTILGLEDGSPERAQAVAHVARATSTSRN